MSIIDRKTIDHVALLARLELSDKEREIFTTQLEDILKYIEKLKELDTSRVEPMAYAAAARNVFREDEPRPSIDLEEAMKNAPSRAGDFFKVPKVID
ncbi:MAG: asparaginyl/glutamyl-tRNA amidotransferase subunit C [Planctomycetes bacterium RIFCSPLOWO2_12_FULL_50_35]|nr:MAG: asparaginyl/glutamyl-tRNA amidotransferase subunit C [Planctomycetes bacterium RIFCSPLOWO2_12_FULL_50_35]